MTSMFRGPVQRWSSQTKKYILPLIIGWSGIVLLSLTWNWRVVHENNLEKARLVARSFYELAIEFRRWGSLHGGVYVPVTDTLQPNPYLTAPDREVTTSRGKKLTLVNPAWMTRQVFEQIGKRSALPIVSHLTSLKYTNPVNKPDAWEEKTLRAFEEGQQNEISEATMVSGEPYMRVIRPFRAEQSCLKCHGHQGYKVGDIRGAISIAVPLKPHLEAESREQAVLALSHGILWLIGAGGIMLFSSRIQRHQRRIGESEAKYRILFENNPQPMWVYDLETLRFLTVNEAAVARYGYTREEFLNMTISDIRPAEDIDRLMENVSRVTTGLDKAGVWRHRTKEGSVIYVEITSHVVDFVDRRGELVLVHDVTERLKLEDQLRQAQKMEAVGLLAGGVAHDFNNVLTAIIGYGNLLLMKLGGNDPLRSYAENILATSQRAAQLTQSLLAFSRKQVINPAAIDLNSIIHRVEKLLKRLIPEDIELRTEFTGENTTILADSVQIEQVLMNLVTNARDAMSGGGILAITSMIVAPDDAVITARGQGAGGPFVRLTVADTGAGMDERTRERIFEPFFTTKEMGKGTGLGLATVYGIVKQHRGFIDVESAPGRGTSFHLYFPLIREDTAQTASRSSAPPKGGTETILVAEDDEMLRGLCRSILKEFGYTVIEAKDGVDAVEVFRKDRDRIDMLLLDVIMPRKNGKVAYDEIRAIKADVKVLFISGYSADMISREGILERGLHFISKPLSPTDLLQKVREVLDGKEA